MLKITDPGYFLPKITALSWGDVLLSGANRPQIIRGICSTTGKNSDYVVKYLGAERMYPGACAKELIAACMANQMDFCVPEPVTINITPEFVKTLLGNQIYLTANKSIGLNYGSKYIGSASTFINSDEYPESASKYFADIFGFDMLISNVDRNNTKRNLFFDGEKFVLYDHELAFGFIHDIPVNQQPWIIKESQQKSISEHLFYKYLKGKRETFTNFASRLDYLNAPFWDKLEKIIPFEWMSDEYSKIKLGILATIEHKDEFFNQLKIILQ